MVVIYLQGRLSNFYKNTPYILSDDEKGSEIDIIIPLVDYNIEDQLLTTFNINGS